MKPLNNASHLKETGSRAYHLERAGFRINELVLSPTRKVPRRYHCYVQDTSYVIEGRLRILLQEPKEEVQLRPGEYDHAPRI